RFTRRPPADRLAMLRGAARDAIAGGRIYDSHIADVARASGARVVVTDNRRHFVYALRYELRVDEFPHQRSRQRRDESDCPFGGFVPLQVVGVRADDGWAHGVEAAVVLYRCETDKR